MRTIKLLAFLIIAGLAGLLGYAYLGDMRPAPRQIIIDIPLGPADLQPNPTGVENGG